MHPPKVSVIIPCYNTGALLKRAVFSASNQTWPNIEILVINDGSTDHLTLDILSHLPCTVIHKSNEGLPAARNTGIKSSDGPLLFFLDSDDWIEPDCISCLATTLLNSSADFTFSQLILEGELQGRLSKGCNPFEQLFLNQIPYSILVRRSALLQVGFYDEYMTVGYEDWEFNIRLILHGCLPIYCPVFKFYYHVSSNGMLRSISRNHHYSLWKYIIDKHRSSYSLTSLVSFYCKYRNTPSSYPLYLYLPLYILSFLPKAIFSFFFSRLIKYSLANKSL
jgi:glycosyltransferase involved in cell wall biosynthesis